MKSKIEMISMERQQQYMGIKITTNHQKNNIYIYMQIHLPIEFDFHSISHRNYSFEIPITTKVMNQLK